MQAVPIRMGVIIINCPIIAICAAAKCPIPLILLDALGTAYLLITAPEKNFSTMMIGLLSKTLTAIANLRVKKC
jgi:hypothetical protein